MESAHRYFRIGAPLILEWTHQSTGICTGVTREGFDQYFADMKTAGAYYLGKVKLYETARDIKSFGISAAPQSFVYVEEL